MYIGNHVFPTFCLRWQTQECPWLLFGCSSWRHNCQSSLWKFKFDHIRFLIRSFSSDFSRKGRQLYLNNNKILKKEKIKNKFKPKKKPFHASDRINNTTEFSTWASRSVMTQSVVNCRAYFQVVLLLTVLILTYYSLAASSSISHGFVFSHILFLERFFPRIVILILSLSIPVFTV